MITLFYRNPLLLYLSIVVILVAGISAALHIPRIEDPRVDTRDAFIVTYLPGASAERVESLVTEKLETELEEIAEIKYVESASRPNVSFVHIELEAWVDSSTNQAIFSKIRDKMADARLRMPPEVKGPFFDDKRTQAAGFTLIAAINWEGEPDEAPLGIMNRVAQDLADKLRRLSGTEYVDVFGSVDEEIAVLVDPRESVGIGMTVGDIAKRVAAGDTKLPSGFYRNSHNDYQIEVEGEIKTLSRVAALPIAVNEQGNVLHLGDIATVRKDYKRPPDGIAINNGLPTVLVAARTETHVKSDNWVAKAREVIAEENRLMGGNLSLNLIYDQTYYTLSRLQNLLNNLFMGVVLVIAVVFISMGWKASIIVSSALPLCASVTIFSLMLLDEQIHQIAIFGMIVAIGLLIDNAIVITDEIRKEIVNRGRTPLRALDHAVRHLIAPLSASTLTTVLAFMPILLLPGSVGDFVRPIAISVEISLLASFVLSLTIIASLAARFIRPSKTPEYHWWRYGISNSTVTAHYESLLRFFVERAPRLGAVIVIAVAAAGFALAPTLGNVFFPPTDRDQFEVKVWLDSSSSVTHTAEVIKRVDEMIRSHPEVTDTFWLVGNSAPMVYYNQMMNKDGVPFYGEGVVTTTNSDVARPVINELQQELTNAFPGLQIVVRPFGQGPPIEAPVMFRLFGPSLEKLRSYGDQLRLIMSRQPDITFSSTSLQGGKPKLKVVVDEDEALLSGFTLAEIAMQLQAGLEGALGGSLIEKLEQLPVRVRYADIRDHMATIATMRLINSKLPGGWIPLNAVGKLELKPEYVAITHYDGMPTNVLFGYLWTDIPPIDVTRAVLKEFHEEVQMEHGYSVGLAGDAEKQADAVKNLMIYIPVLIVLVIATLVISLQSVFLAFHIMVVAVLSLGMGLLSLWISGYPIGFNPIIGSMGLIGVAINGSIVVLAAIRQNREAKTGNGEDIVKTVVDATRHILSTTFTTTGSFIPLLFFVKGEFWPPLAIIIAGGVALSTLCSLLYTPCIYAIAAKKRWV